MVGARLADRIVGTWELVADKVEDRETGKLIGAMGGAPRGRLIFTKDGWVAFNLEGSARKPAATDAERAALTRTPVAYIGRYRIEGDQWVTSVQTARAPERVGTEQRRTIHVDGDDADVTTPWRVVPDRDDGRLSRSIIRFRHIPRSRTPARVATVREEGGSGRDSRTVPHSRTGVGARAGRPWRPVEAVYRRVGAMAGAMAGGRRPGLTGRR